MDTLDTTPDIQIVFDPAYVASLIIKETTHDLAQILAVTDPTTGTSLLEELLYWRSAGRI